MKDFTHIPQELRDLSQWVCWKLVQKKGAPKPTKVPVQPNGRPASTTDPRTWSTFDQVVAAAPRFSGIGFVFKKGQGLVGIDFDAVRDPRTEQVETWVMWYLVRLFSYTEISQSGRGFHSIVRADLPDGGWKRGRVEMYNTGRFFVMTANAMPFLGLGEIQSRSLKAVHARLLAGKLDPAPSSPSIRKTNGGRPRTTGGSDSEMDYALIRRVRKLLGKWGNDPARVEREFKRRYPRRYSERNALKGQRGSQTYIGYSISNQIRSGR